LSDGTLPTFSRLPLFIEINPHSVACDKQSTLAFVRIAFDILDSLA
jgi:hypothetical protein